MNLLETIDIILAFAVVMLFLSLIVTVLVQLTQAMLRLRSKYLREGLTRLARQLGASAEDAEMIANQVLRPLALAGAADTQTPRLGGAQALAVTAISAQEIGRLIPAFGGGDQPRAVVEGMTDTSGGDAATLMGALPQESLDSIRTFSSTQFERRVKLITLAWALVVAFVLQVSAPALLTNLSADQSLRETLAAEAIRENAQRETSADRSEDMDFEQTLAELNGQVVELARFNIVPWGHGNGFYWAAGEAASDGTAAAQAQGLNGHVMLDNIIGVLITALLLSLGAPFWYDLIAKFAGLKDALQRRTSDS